MIKAMGYKDGEMYVEFFTPEHTACEMEAMPYDLFQCDNNCKECEYYITIPDTSRIYTYTMDEKRAKEMIENQRKK